MKEIDIKNRTCYYFDGIIRFWDTDIDFSDILLDEKLFKEKVNKNIFIYNILYKTSMGAKPLPIRLDKIDGFIIIHDKIRYLVLFDYSYCCKIYDKIKYLISEKSSITDSINHNFVRIVIVHMVLYLLKKYWILKSVVNKDKNNYYYNIFLEKASSKDKSSTEYF